MTSCSIRKEKWLVEEVRLVGFVFPFNVLYEIAMLRALYPVPAILKTQSGHEYWRARLCDGFLSDGNSYIIPRTKEIARIAIQAPLT